MAPAIGPTFAFLAGMTRLRTAALATVTLALALTSTGCNHSLAVSRPKDAKLDAAYTEVWTQEFYREVQDGDIILRRGYAVLSDVILLVTRSDMSHAGIYDAETDTVIDAVSSGVRAIPAAQFLGASHRWRIVRPAGLTRDERHAAVERARATIGTGFDFSGFIGLDDGDRFYCSELVAWALEARDEVYADDVLVTPAELTALGPVVFDSGERGARPTASVDPYWR